MEPVDVPDDDLEVIVVEEPEGTTTWRFERSFLTSNWTCLWGRGCQGILDEPAPELQQGCCSIGAGINDEDEARLVTAMSALLGPDEFEYFAHAQVHGVFSDDTRQNTAVIDGACVFFNRPGFEGGTGCALHQAAVRHGDSPVDWKPSVCWELPIRVDWVNESGGAVTATLRRWQRADWGPDGDTMAWCCTEAPDAYVGERPVIESMADELEAVVGSEVFVELRRRLG